MPPEVGVRAYKRMDLSGGVLLVSVPSAGIGNILLTDYVLEAHAMDQIAALDSDGFPPLALVHRGKPRFPVRVHADARARVAVLRSEFSPPPTLARAVARAILAWAAEQRFARIVLLDTVHSGHMRDGAGELALWFLGSTDAAKAAAAAAGVPEFGEGVLGGVGAMLLLEARFAGADVVALIAEVREPLDDARCVPAFARALPPLVPGLKLDLDAMDRDVEETERAVRRLREAAERALAREREPETAAPEMFG